MAEVQELIRMRLLSEALLKMEDLGMNVDVFSKRLQCISADGLRGDLDMDQLRSEYSELASDMLEAIDDQE